MKKIIVLILILGSLFLASCGKIIPNKEPDSRHAVEVSFITYAIPYDAIRIMDIGTCVEYPIGGHSYHCTRLEHGYIFGLTDGGVAYVPAEAFE